MKTSPFTRFFNPKSFKSYHTNRNLQGSKIPEPPAGQKWKEVRHDNKVTWLACWIENVQGGYKYTMLGANSRIKGEKDWMKYEKARELKKHIRTIREDYEVSLCFLYKLTYEL